MHVTFVDASGNRTRVPARIGQSLLDVARLHKLPMDGDANDSSNHAIKHNEDWTEDVFGEGPYSCNSHVLIAPEWNSKVPAPLDAELARLDQLDEDLSATSRLGENVFMSKDLDGLVVYIPPMPPSDIP